MIEEIKINGILYKLIENCEENINECDMCDLNVNLNEDNKNYYYKKQ